jgi:hypothetical protein
MLRRSSPFRTLLSDLIASDFRAVDVPASNAVSHALAEVVCMPFKVITTLVIRTLLKDSAAALTSV